MKRPNVDRYKPHALYLLKLFAELRELGRSKADVCRQLGINYRTMSDYTNPKCPTEIDYCTQYAIETVLEWEREFRSNAKNDKWKVDISGIHPHNGQ